MKYRTPEEIEEEAIRRHAKWMEFGAECCKENALSYWIDKVLKESKASQ